MDGSQRIREYVIYYIKILLKTDQWHCLWLVWDSLSDKVWQVDWEFDERVETIDCWRDSVKEIYFGDIAAFQLPDKIA